MDKTDKIFVAGGTGLAGSAIVRCLLKNGFSNVVASYHSRYPYGYSEKTECKCKFVKIDLLEPNVVKEFFNQERPLYVFLAAAKVGGIMANHSFRGQFIYENLQIQNNVIHNSYLSHVKKLIFLGSTCIYPFEAIQPMEETCLMSGALEYLSEPYGIAKIAGIKMCESYNLQYGTNFISVMPTNLYGPNDNYDFKNSHFLPAFIRKMHLGKSFMGNDWEAIRNDLKRNPVIGFNCEDSVDKMTEFLSSLGIKKKDDEIVEILLWGSGSPRREILHSDELASACLHIMRNVDFIDLCRFLPIQYSDGFIKEEIRNTQVNIGVGVDNSLFDIAMIVKEVVGYGGNIVWDCNMPDGTARKLTDVSKLNTLGWKAELNLKEGLKQTYRFYLDGKL